MLNADTLEQEILATIEPPAIPDFSVDIRACGALPGTDTPQTAVIQRAIDMVYRAGGGRVVVPEGRFLTGALRLRSRVDLHLQTPGSVLRFVTEADGGEYPLVLCHWEGTPCYNYSPLLYAFGESDIAVTGPGTLDGQAGPGNWYAWHHQEEQAWCAAGVNPQAAASQRLRQMNQQGVPVEQRRFGAGCWLRPNFIQFLRCRRVLLQGFTIQNSPMWNLNPVFCQSVTVRGLNVLSHGPNGDGCDPESCDGILIEDNYFATGDDCISLKSGRDRDGRTANTPCRNVVIRRNIFADGHGGIALGSEMSGGLRRIVARANRFDSPNLTYALRLKSNARRGGVVEQVVLADSEIRRVGGATVHGTMMYEDGPNGDYLPVFRDILIENVTAHGGEYGIFLEAFPQVPITGLTLRHIRIDGAGRALRAANWQGAVLEDVVINGEAYPRPYAVRLHGVPYPGGPVRAVSRCCVEGRAVRYLWQLCGADGVWRPLGIGEDLTLPEDCRGLLRLAATDCDGRTAHSIAYRIVAAPMPDAAAGMPGSAAARRLQARGMLDAAAYDPGAPVTRGQLAAMLGPLLGQAPQGDPLARAIAQGAMALRDGAPMPQGTVPRQELATVVMACCGVSYRNASTTMPVCADVGQVSTVHGTHVARALHYGFLALDGEGRFHPETPATMAEAVTTLDAVADFAGI